ncbi:MAG: zinc-dependent metalloprotease [Alistipes sp.]|jgi:hypothetical protein|nr:zinc-dependent metalloprotease [Alistipes sp.]
MSLLKKSSLAIMAMVTMAVTSCAVEPLTDTETTAVENPDYAIIRSLGLSTEDIVETDDSYIVEGDIVFEKKSMRDYAGKTRQKYYYLVSPTKVNDIKVYIYPELQTNIVSSNGTWYQATIDALAAWSSRSFIPNCIINFRTVTSEASADVFVRRDPTVSAIASADFPFFGDPGRSVRISTNYDSYTLAQKTYIMVHEFGHVLGFIHMNESGIQIPGTTTSDPQSIMVNTSIGGLSWNSNGYTGNYDGFTPNDVIAAQATYVVIWSLSMAGPATCVTTHYN